MDESRTDSLVRDLVRLLGELRELYGQLGAHMGLKLDAIRRGDSDAIHSITAREMMLAGRASEREGLRRQIAQRLGEHLGIDRGAARSMRLADLAERLIEPRRSQLLGAAAGLRDKLEEVERAQRVNALVTREILRHLGDVLAVMTGGGAKGDVYSRRGRHDVPRSANVFEAVG